MVPALKGDFARAVFAPDSWSVTNPLHILLDLRKVVEARAKLTVAKIIDVRPEGDDIAVVGFSNWFFTALLDPPLTSVDQPGFEMGQEAAKLLIRQIEVRTKDRDAEVQPETKVLKTRLIVRESSLKKGKKN